MFGQFGRMFQTQFVFEPFPVGVDGFDAQVQVLLIDPGKANG